jgi:hypothetical protein
VRTHSWEARYIAVVTGRDLEVDRLDLTGWVSLNNQTGSTYDRARLKLIAGDVNRMRDPWAVVVPTDPDMPRDFPDATSPNINGAGYGRPEEGVRGEEFL